MFETLLSTLCRFPNTPLAGLFREKALSPHPASSTANASFRKTSKKLKKKISQGSAKGSKRAADGVVDSGATAVLPAGEVFLDVNPVVFEHVLDFLRTGDINLPVNDEKLRRGVVHQLDEWGLTSFAFPAVPTSEDAASQADGNSGASKPGELPPGHVRLPDVCVVQMCDHMQHDQGVKRHALTITYGSDGFTLKSLCKAIRKDLSSQLASTYWQCYQTNERAAFFVTTKVANGTADLMTTSITQQVIQHTELMGYSLVSSYVTLSPDVVHTSVRMLIHNLIFRRIRQPTLEDTDALALIDNGAEVDDLVMPNFQEPQVGPQKSMFDDLPSVVPPGQKVGNIWKS